jgi:hypothetical protein
VILDQQTQRAAEWRQNAARLRIFAEEFIDLPRDNLLHLAKQWDALAGQIEKGKPVGLFL